MMQALSVSAINQSNAKTRHEITEIKKNDIVCFRFTIGSHIGVEIRGYLSCRDDKDLYLVSHNGCFIAFKKCNIGKIERDFSGEFSITLRY